MQASAYEAQCHAELDACREAHCQLSETTAGLRASLANATLAKELAAERVHALEAKLAAASMAAAEGDMARERDMSILQSKLAAVQAVRLDAENKAAQQVRT